MKQTILKLTFAMMIMALLTTPVWGRGPGDVTKTAHNMGYNRELPDWEQWSANVDEVCVFCHTPHGGLLTGPLWNHSMPSATSFTHYNSATVSDHIKGLSVGREVNAESLLCMACHDGSVAVDHLVNEPNGNYKDDVAGVVSFFGGKTEVTMVPMLNGTPGKRIGGSMADPGGTGDLSDDHPISFSYTAVLADAKYNPITGSHAGELHTVAEAEAGNGTDGIRFFRAEANVECSSCHDPHVDYITYPEYTPFLVMSNEGSGLCLACHNK